MTRIISSISVLAVILLLVAACESPDQTRNDEGAADEATEEGTDEAADAAPEIPEACPESDDEPHPALTDPSLADEQAPQRFHVLFETTAGNFAVTAHRDWAPNGVDRFYNLVDIGYFEDIAIFRVIDGFMAQFGIHGQPQVNAAWRTSDIPDDPVVRSNTRGKLSFAMRGPNTRTTQLFINFGNNSNLDGQGFSPFAEVIDGMDVVDSIYDGYGEGAPRGQGPDQGRIQNEGNNYLRANFENLDYIERACIF